jgi:1D-myo-inositol-tetrakisphosphate 5-kinase/inositol-polyphosphate multikinase
MTSSTFLTVPLASQVGGHSGVVQTTQDGSLIIKPALPLELQFYQSAVSHDEFIPLRQFIPQFYGTLRLEGQVDTEATIGNNDHIVFSKFAGGSDEIRDE